MMGTDMENVLKKINKETVEAIESLLWHAYEAGHVCGAEYYGERKRSDVVFRDFEEWLRDG